MGGVSMVLIQFSIGYLTAFIGPNNNVALYLEASSQLYFEKCIIIYDSATRIRSVDIT